MNAFASLAFSNAAHPQEASAESKPTGSLCPTSARELGAASHQGSRAALGFRASRLRSGKFQHKRWKEKQFATD